MIRGVLGSVVYAARSGRGLGFNFVCWPRCVRSTEHGRMAYFIVLLLEYEGSVLALAVDCDGSLPEHHSLHASYDYFMRRGLDEFAGLCFVRDPGFSKIQILTLR